MCDSGVCTLKDDELIPLNDAKPEEGGVKIVLGPGTGLGQGYLCKSKFSPYYEVYPCEGGHTEFSVRSKEDFELLEFGYRFIEESDNIENQRANGKIDRMSIERMCAGPAVPLIYDYMRNRYPEMERTLEKEGYNMKQLKSKQIIDQGILKKDPLCMKVV